MAQGYLDRLVGTAIVREVEGEFEATIEACDDLTVTALSYDEALTLLRAAAHEWIEQRLDDGDPLPVVEGLLDEDD